MDAPALDLPFDADAMLLGLRRWVECESPTFDAAAVSRMMDVAARDLALLGARIEAVPGRSGYGPCVRATFPHPREGAEPNVLVLDEPTNHLDLESREALEAALQDFPGSVLLVSHDRALLDAVGTRTVAVEDGTLHSYTGGWPEFVRIRAERESDEKAAKRAKPAKEKPKPAAAAKPVVSKHKVEKLEARIAEAEAQLRAVEEELADPSAWNDPRTAKKSTARHNEAKKAVEDLYAEYETVAG